jgi:hypothetical protein
LQSALTELGIALRIRAWHIFFVKSPRRAGKVIATKSEEPKHTRYLRLMLLLKAAGYVVAAVQTFRSEISALSDRIVEPPPVDE